MNSTISERAVQLIDRYALSHGLQAAGALIAATAMELELTLLSANAKHFAFIEGLAFERFMPEPA